MKNSKTTAHLGMLLWALIVGVSFPIVGLLSNGLPPMLLTATRFGIAVVALLPLAYRARGSLPPPAALLVYAAMGLCLAAFFGITFWAAHRVSALSMAALFVSVPMLAYCLGRCFGVEQRNGRLLAILATGAIGALGLALAEGRGRAADLSYGWEELVFFLGCFGSALYPVLSKSGLLHRLLSPDAAVRTFWSLALGGALIGLVGLVFEAGSSLTAMTASDALLVAYLGIVSSGATFWLMQRGTAVLTPGEVTAYSYLAPFVSMLLLFIKRPDVLSWHWLPGSLLVIGAIICLVRGSLEKRT